jgi:hypothetical protein
LKPKRERERYGSVVEEYMKGKVVGEIRDTSFPEGGGKRESIVMLEGSQASPACLRND